MRVASFGNNRVGILQDGSICDVTDWAFRHCKLRAEDPMIVFLHALNSGLQPEGEWLSAHEINWGPPLTQPSKIIAAASNYLDHIKEMSVGKEMHNGIREKGFFLKAPSSIIGPEQSILLPFSERRTDHEAEIAVVIGKTARHIKESEAMDCVFGYTCLLDITVRGTEDRGFRKSFDTFTPIGPYITSKDEVANPNDLQIVCKVNGQIRQNESSQAMIMHIPELVSWVSSVMTLLPGDLIATGTPAGVSAIQSGDRVEATIERLGSFAVNVKSSAEK